MQATIELDRLLPKEDEVLLVSDQNFLLFTPLLPQIASSRINPRHIVQTIREIRGKRRFRFRRDTVAEHRPDGAPRDSRFGSRRLRRAGDRARQPQPLTFGISGARENTWDFKTLEDAVVLRDHVLDMCEHADHTTEEAARRATC